jgi:hypothetical protein
MPSLVTPLTGGIGDVAATAGLVSDFFVSGFVSDFVSDDSEAVGVGDFFGTAGVVSDFLAGGGVGVVGALDPAALVPATGADDASVPVGAATSAPRLVRFAAPFAEGAAAAGAPAGFEVAGFEVAGLGVAAVAFAAVAFGAGAFAVVAFAVALVGLAFTAVAFAVALVGLAFTAVDLAAVAFAAVVFAAVALAGLVFAAVALEAEAFPALGFVDEPLEVAAFAAVDVPVVLPEVPADVTAACFLADACLAVAIWGAPPSTGSNGGCYPADRVMRGHRCPVPRAHHPRVGV